MAGIAHTFDDAPIRRHLAALALLDQRGFDGLRREIGEYFVGQVQDNLQAQKLADGSPMPQSKRARGEAPGQRYRKQLKSGRYPVGKTLIDTGRLRDSYVYQLAGASVEIGSALVYAAIHHFGGETGAAGHRFTLPPRPVLGVGPAQELALGNMLIADIQRTQGGAR